MIGFLVATQPARTIVIQRGGGGTPWWVPLLVALAAAAASYYVTWRFKKGDVNRENAFGVAGLADEAERIARSERVDPQGVLRLLREAQVRAWPMGDPDLDDRIRAAIAYGVDFEGWTELHNPEEMGTARHWLSAAIWNVRRGLLPHLFALKLFLGHGKPSAGFLSSMS